jgi:hypothetical protein
MTKFKLQSLPLRWQLAAARAAALDRLPVRLLHDSMNEDHMTTSMSDSARRQPGNHMA